MSDENTGRTVKFKLDPRKPPQMRKATQARLKAMTDQDIDFSDIPRSPEGVVWTRPGALVCTENSLLMVRLAEEQRFPFEVRVPNAITRQAMRDLEQGKSKRFDSAEALFKDLGI